MPEAGEASRDVPSSGSSAWLAVLAGVALTVSLMAGYVNRAVLTPAHFAHRASSALEDSAVRDKIASAISDALSSETGGVVPATQVRAAVDDVIADPDFAKQFRAAVVKVHTALVENGADSATLDLSGVVPLVLKRIQAAEPGVPTPPSLPPIRLAIKPPTAVNSAVATAHSLTWLPAVAGVLALLLFAALLLTATDRPRAARRGALAALVAGLVMVAIYVVLREIVVHSTSDSGVAGGIFGAFFDDFAVASLILAGAGLLGWWGAGRFATAKGSEPAAAPRSREPRPAPAQTVSPSARRVQASRRPPPRPADSQDAAATHVLPPLPDTEATKTCPDCAETVLAAARVCKHCGFRFEPQPPGTS